MKLRELFDLRQLLVENLHKIVSAKCTFSGMHRPSVADSYGCTQIGHSLHREKAWSHEGEIINMSSTFTYTVRQYTATITCKNY